MKSKIVSSLFALIAVIVTGSSFTDTKPSELAKLMKQMLVYIQQEKKQIENNQPALSFPASSQKMSKAKITKGKKISENHEQYISRFYSNLSNYYKAADSLQRTSMYNVLVNSCISCHQHECPGPITVIKKNLF